MSTIDHNSEISIKKLFYVLRPLLAAKWCMEKNEIAPMRFDLLIELIPKKLQNRVKDLVAFKMTAMEASTIKIDDDLKSWIMGEFEHFSGGVKTIEKTRFDLNLLDAFFLKTIKAHDN